MNIQEIRDFQSRQSEIVALIGAYCTSLKGFKETLNPGNRYQVDMENVRRLQPTASAFIDWARSISDFYHKNHYQTYYQALKGPSMEIVNLLSNQTLPSRQLDGVGFYTKFCSCIDNISEVMMATAKIVISPIDINIRAGNSFEAYQFFLSIIKVSAKSILIIDPYIDETLFYRYLYKVEPQVSIKIVADEDKLKGGKLAAFEDIENLYKAGHPAYVREMRNSLHDRYLITETNAYALGGSIKDAAKKSDYSVIEVSEVKRNELLQQYA